MPFYKSLKVTTPIALALFIFISVFGLKYIDLSVSKALSMEIFEQKNIEISHKIGRDVEIVLSFSDSMHDINKILTNYLISDINYIAVYADNAPTYRSFYNFSVEDREEFIEKSYDRVVKENIVLTYYNEKYNIFQTLIRYTLPKKITDVVSKDFGVIYYEYSLDRDLRLIENQTQQRFVVNFVWGILLLVLISIFVVLKFVRPIVKLSKATQQVGNEDTSHESIEHNSIVEDEMSYLFNSFNQMSNKIVDSRVSLHAINKDLLKQTKKAEQASNSKSEFLANMSHEIRTPLNAIMGFIGILKENETNKEKLDYLQTITSSSRSLVHIINDILDFSKIESGKLSIEHIDFNPISELQATKNLFLAKCEEKSILLHTDFEELPESLTGDSLRIKQVVNNLISNAIKFTPQNHDIYLNIKYENEALYVSVRDEGIGISEEYMERIFEEFTQADASTTRQYGGTGLGLSISYNLVKLMGGELHVKSKLGVGSEFYFNLPLKQGSEIIDKTAKTQSTDFSNLKILLVEDNKANQLFMKVIFKQLKITFDIANDGLEAIEQFKDNKYDVILMDENMPNMNGIKATQEILKLEKEQNLKHTRIIALTANALKGDRERFLDAGMDDYLTKPLDKDKLVNCLC